MIFLSAHLFFRLYVILTASHIYKQNINNK